MKVHSKYAPDSFFPTPLDSRPRKVKADCWPEYFEPCPKEDVGVWLGEELYWPATVISVHGIGGNRVYNLQLKNYGRYVTADLDDLIQLEYLEPPEVPAESAPSPSKQAGAKAQWGTGLPIKAEEQKIQSVS